MTPSVARVEKLPVFGGKITMEEQFDLLWKKLKDELEKQTTAITESVHTSLSLAFDEKLKPIIQENTEMKIEIDKLKSTVKRLEIDSRKNNIILFGIKEEENENIELMDIVLETLNGINKNSIKSNDWDRWEISEVQRIGKKEDSRIRPIKLVLTLGWRKMELLKNRKNFPKNISVTEDFSKETLEKRKALVPKMIEARESGKYAIIKNDKLIVKEKREKKENNDKRKRVPSSPPKTPPSNFSTTTGENRVPHSQPNKVPKTNNYKIITKEGSSLEQTQSKNN